ncbi:MAG: 3-dehydroquinate synthase [Nonlabens sp.]
MVEELRFRESVTPKTNTATGTMNSIKSTVAQVHFNDLGYQAINAFIASKLPSTIFVLVDENTHEYCYPRFIPRLETTARIEIIEIDAGEKFKNIETCTGVWNVLVELECDRNSLFINLGGGVITDLGGFVASTIKRGIDFIHVPTTVLGMVDAAIGGKNGVDLGHLKNQIGVINAPVMTLIDTAMIQSLSERQLLNGSVEMFKHGLIVSRDYWRSMLAVNNRYLSTDFDHLIWESITIKNDVVESDPFEKGNRKALNYGHTAGHAIESHCLTSADHENLLHGEAVAAGILIESFLSQQLTGLPAADYEEIKKWYRSLDIKLQFNESDVTMMLELMKHDKKNINGEIRFVLLTSIGSFSTDQVAGRELVFQAFKELD